MGIGTLKVCNAFQFNLFAAVDKYNCDVVMEFFILLCNETLKI